MDHDFTDHPKAPRKARRGSASDLPPRTRPLKDSTSQGSTSQDLPSADLDPATSAAEEDDEARLPEVPEEPAEAVAEGPLAIGHAAIENAVRLAPTSPGVYRMLDAAGDVLYVGKARNAEEPGHRYTRVARRSRRASLRMVAATAIDGDRHHQDRGRGAAARGAT